MDPVNSSEPSKQEDLGETKLSLSAELFCDQVLEEPSGAEECTSPLFVAEENGGGNGTFGPGGNDFGLDFVGIPGDVLVGVSDFGGDESVKDSIFADVEKELMGEQNLENGGPRMVEVAAIEESAGVVQMQEEEISNARESVVQMHEEEIGNASASVVQMHEEEIGNVNAGVQMQEEEKGNADMEWNEVDSPGKIDVSSDGISLAVEFSGPPNGTSEDEDGNISGKEKSSAVEDVGHEEIPFLVGAVVWAKTKKSEVWWPGVICDAVDPSRRDFYLVRHLASSNAVWHTSSHLKHFLEGFDQLCHQQDSRSFNAALERAIIEIGERVKAQMSCPCFSTDGEKSSSLLTGRTVQRYSWSEDKHGVSWASSEFHPAGFLAMIKHLARDTPATDKIKLISTRSCLTAIYRSLGHQQLSIQQFAPDAVKHLSRAGSKQQKKDGAKDELLASSGSPDPAENDVSGGDSSRRRRKSKYLSYPFIDPKKGKEKDTGEKVSDPDPQVDKSNSSEGGKSKKLKKPVSGKSGLLNLPSKFRDISSSSENILSDLRCQAINCLPPKRRAYSDSVCRFLCGFRSFRFLNPEIAKEQVYNHEDELPISASAVPEGNVEASGVAVTPSNSAPKKITPADGTPKKSRKRKEDKASSGTMPSGALNGKEDAGSATQKSEKVPHKRMKAIADSSPLPPPPGFGLPDLNSDLPAAALASAEGNQAIGSTVLGLPAEGLTHPGRSNSFRFVQLLKDVQTMGPNFLQYMTQTNHIHAISQTAAQAAPTMHTFDIVAPPQANGSNLQVGSVLNSMQPLSPVPTVEKKKRKRKPKTLDSQNTVQNTAVPSPIPDLNGQAADPVSPGDKAPGVLSSARRDKMPIKRRNMAAPVNAPSASLLPHPLTSPPAVPGSAPRLTPQPLMPPPTVPGSAPRLTPQPLMPLPGVPGSASRLPPHPLMPPPGIPGPAPRQTPVQPPLQMTIPSIPAPVGPGAQSNLLAMQQNLKMMTSMLEKAGNNLSVDKRNMLETEINGLMKKISTMVGSSSSA